MLAKKKAMEQNFECKFCGTKFHKETTLTTHMCVKKRRHMDINTAGSRFGFRTFQRFFELTAKAKKLKSQEEFINSTYYIGFVKFGNHLASLKPVHIEQFIDFVIMGGIPLKDWTDDRVYYLYIENLYKKEPAGTGTDRTITEIMDWADKNNTPFNDFFKTVSANEAAHMIRTGRVSPWVLYLSGTGDNLMTRFTDDHTPLIGTIIDPGFWMKKFKKDGEEVDYIRDLLEQAGL